MKRSSALLSSSDPGEAVRARPPENLRTTQAEERPQPPRPPCPAGLHRAHRRRPAHTGATQQAEQQGLGLVVLVVTEGEPVAIRLGERGMARRARGGLEAVGVGAIDLDAEDLQGNARGRAALDAGARPRGGIRAEAVVDVGCEQTEAEARLQPAQDLEQHHRVRPAGERAAHPAAGADAGRGEDRGGGFGRASRRGFMADTGDAVLESDRGLRAPTPNRPARVRVAKRRKPRSGPAGAGGAGEPQAAFSL